MEYEPEDKFLIKAQNFQAKRLPCGASFILVICNCGFFFFKQPQIYIEKMPACLAQTLTVLRLCKTWAAVGSWQ
jgi:hypothetical protein